MVKKTTETVGWSTFISWKYASAFKIMFSAQCKIFGSKKVKQLGLSFQKFWKDGMIFNTCSRMKTLLMCGINLLLITQFW